MNCLTVVFILAIKLQCVVLMQKCCDTETYLRKENSTYICDKDEDRRLQIRTSHRNFLEQNVTVETTCYDTDSQNITMYKILNQTIIRTPVLDFNFFTKCCPLDYHYDSKTHGCVRKRDLDQSFISQHFVKIGLPHCKVVVDYKLKSGNDLNYRLELGNLFLDGESHKFGEGNFCMDRDENDDLIARGCHQVVKEICDDVKCIRKCCPDGQSFVHGKKCLNTHTHGLNLNFSSNINNSQDSFAIIHNYECEKIYILKPRYRYYLDEKGVFWGFYNRTNSFKPYTPDDEKSYCIEHVTMANNISSYKFFMCFPEKSLNLKYSLTRWLKIVSCVFIVLTAAIYFLLPEMLNLFGKILLNFCAAVFICFTLLAYGQFDINLGNTNCRVVGFLASYASLSSFAWLNIMCFNIWYTFGSPKTFMLNHKRSDFKRLFLYCLYGWGSPLVVTLSAFLAFMSNSTPEALRPNLGYYKCYWEKRAENYSALLFYAAPLIAMETANTFFFIKTIIYCARVKSEINRMNDTRKSVRERRKVFNTDKEQLILVLKLSVAMGIFFIFEVSTTVYNISFTQNVVLQHLEAILDAVNCLQGVFIFIIFVCKNKVVKLCKTRIFGDKTRKISVSSLTTQQVSLPLTYDSKMRRSDAN